MKQELGLRKESDQELDYWFKAFGWKVAWVVLLDDRDAGDYLLVLRQVADFFFREQLWVEVPEFIMEYL